MYKFFFTVLVRAVVKKLLTAAAAGTRNWTRLTPTLTRWRNRKWRHAWRESCRRSGGKRGKILMREEWKLRKETRKVRWMVQRGPATARAPTFEWNGLGLMEYNTWRMLSQKKKVNQEVVDYFYPMPWARRLRKIKAELKRNRNGQNSLYLPAHKLHMNKDQRMSLCIFRHGLKTHKKLMRIQTLWFKWPVRKLYTSPGYLLIRNTIQQSLIFFGNNIYKSLRCVCYHCNI